MTTDRALDEAALAFLGRIEEIEARLLAWGVTDGGLSEEEILAEIDKFLSGGNVGTEMEADDFLGELLDRKLLLNFEGERFQFYRTRMAEAVRLFARLRQLFHNKKDWRSGATLVADYRFLNRPRSYPVRTIDPVEALDLIRTSTTLTGFPRKVLSHLVRRGEGFKLSQFQVRATAHILAGLNRRRTSGTVVAAGTGSGKTLAFFLPGISHIADKIDDTHWTKILAIYPRQELLKDQLSETFQQARRIDELLKESGRRPVRIGAYFGATPYNLNGARKRWEQRGQDLICPYLPCPSCSQTLLWRKADLDRKIERLTCSNTACARVIGTDQIELTRNGMRDRPPDILFTTTEMLNRKLGDSQDGHVFGVGARAKKKPELLLLDEIHTYSGISGAQVAHLIRRWRHACGTPVQLVGLSATLREAESFFARLVGLPETDVEKVEPRIDQMEQQGMEYLLVLRGDPASGASLLSTTIQTAMLLRRVLDPYDGARSNGAYGRKVFLFTDDLDVTNRLYYDLLDAEGLNSWGRPEREEGSLATLRSSGEADREERFLAGQSWELCEEIGHSLTPDSYLEIGRTSSQDVGVQARGDIIVATAALEVGFNDPAVGAVIQHKAPRANSQFLQRKGRAARPRDMRPWTVVVLSDYGRDRMAYQGYELLFDPELEPNPLPVSNRYVLRMQAAYCLMDWVASQLSATPKGAVWRDFAGPAEQGTSWGPDIKTRQDQAVELLEGLLTDQQRRDELAEHLRGALKLTDDEVHALLWEPPRAVIMNVVPTILRRLRSDWARVSTSDTDPPYDLLVTDHPLPDFVPRQLFSDLNLPEVAITIPPQQRGDEPEDFSMPVAQALREFAPGRISRRFGIKHAYVRHWVPLPDLGGEETQDLYLSSYLQDYDELGPFQIQDSSGAMVEIRCVRPWKLATEKPPTTVLDSSNAFLDWKTQILPQDDGMALELPTVSAWVDFLEEIRFHSHARRSGIRIRRFALGSRASTSMRDGTQFESYIQFMDTATGFDDGPSPVAVGYELDADGFVLRYRHPGWLEGFELEDADLRGFRTAMFLHRVERHPELQAINTFQRDWLSQAYLSALSEEGETTGGDLQEASAKLTGARLSERLDHVLTVILQSPLTSPLGRQQASASDEGEISRLHERLRSLSQDEDVTTALSGAAEILWESPDQDWRDWASRRFKSTLGAAVLDACQQLCPEYDASDLTVDIDSGPRGGIREGLEEIWLTESTMGGGGLVEEIWRRSASDPRRFLQLVQAALQPADFEVVDSQLNRFLDLLERDDEIRELVAQIRDHRSQEQLRLRFETLIDALTRRGLIMSHPVLAALNARVLRAGSSEATDRTLAGLISRWKALERDLGIEVDVRVFAYLASRDADEPHLAETGTGPTEASTRAVRLGRISSLLWPRGYKVRAQSLFAYNGFASLPPSDRALVQMALSDPYQTIPLSSEGWRDEVRQALIDDGACTLTASNHEIPSLKEAIHATITEPLDLGYLLVHPRIEGIQRAADAISVRFSLHEAAG